MRNWAMNNDTLLFRWCFWMLCWGAVATRKDVGGRGALIAFLVFVLLGLLVQFAWWLTKPKKK